MNCPFCEKDLGGPERLHREEVLADAIAGEIIGHALASHVVLFHSKLISHPTATHVVCLCGYEGQRAYDMGEHWRLLSHEEVVDHILQMKLGGGRG